MQEKHFQYKAFSFAIDNSVQEENLQWETLQITGIYHNSSKSWVQYKNPEWQSQCKKKISSEKHFQWKEIPLKPDTPTWDQWSNPTSVSGPSLITSPFTLSTSSRLPDFMVRRETTSNTARPTNGHCSLLLAHQHLPPFSPLFWNPLSLHLHPSISASYRTQCRNKNFSATQQECRIRRQAAPKMYEWTSNTYPRTPGPCPTLLPHYPRYYHSHRRHTQASQSYSHGRTQIVRNLIG